jgi:hypothetical protein
MYRFVLAGIGNIIDEDIKILNKKTFNYFVYSARCIPFLVCILRYNVIKSR